MAKFRQIRARWCGLEGGFFFWETPPSHGAEVLNIFMKAYRLAKGGEALDLLGPGTHTLSTGYPPILNKLVKYPFGGKTPFAAEVYFINKTVNIGMNWGTSTPIQLEDPQYGLILHVGARGQYGISTG